MSAHHTSSSSKTTPVSGCLTRAVASVLVEEPTLEAVTIDPEHEKISVATLGRTDESRLRERISSKLEEAKRADSPHACQLLVSGGTCATVSRHWASRSGINSPSNTITARRPSRA
jgi:hypothetical protein